MAICCPIFIAPAAQSDASGEYSVYYFAGYKDGVKRFEIDQFDTPAAHYLILADEWGRHRASARLLPTDSSHLLGDLYPFLCDGPVPAGPNVREITRFCLDRNQTAGERRMARNQLVTALAEHALATGITDYTGVAEIGWLQQILQFGWLCRPLGRPLRQDGRTLAALHIQIDERTIDGLKRGGVFEPLTFALFGQQELVE